MGKFSIQNHTANKSLDCKVEGAMSVQDALGFINQYKHVVSTIPAAQYTLTFDCTSLGVSTKESQEKLMECFKLYKQAGFKQIVFHTGNNSILMMQLTRLAHSIKLDNFHVD